MARAKGFFLAGLALVLTPCVLADSSLKVTLNGLGTLVGTEDRTRDDKVIHSFQGIPYAEAPSGANRFKAPIPKKWSGELDASRLGKPCPQPNFNDLISGARDVADNPEDCLTLNVYTPDITHKASLPVVIFYHGGAFITGSAADISPNYLLARDVILVVPQYRLGALGFLSAKNDIIPGNAGLLDALEALRWVKKHISKFGGDAKRITIAGHNAGAAIANYLMISPLASGLIKGVILQSGTAVADWATNQAPEVTFGDVAKIAQCGKATAEESAACLMEINPDNLTNAFMDYYSAGHIKAASPIVSRREEPSKTKIMPRKPYEMTMFSRDVPLLLGTTRHDSMWMVNVLLSHLNANNQSTPEFIRDNLLDIVFKMTGYYDKLRMINELVERRFFAYVSPEDMGNSTVLAPGLVDFLSTATMKNPAAQLPQFNTRANSYLYSFEFEGRQHSSINGIGDDPNSLFERGVPHGDDMIYLTPREDIYDPFNKEELLFSKKMVDMWANFITSSDPNKPIKISGPEWPKYKYYKDRLYYKINRENEVGTEYSTEHVAAVEDFVLSANNGN